MQNLKKNILIICGIVFITSIFIYFFMPFLLVQSGKDIKNHNFKRAAQINNFLGYFAKNKLKKGSYYLTAGDCYLELKEIPKAIKAYENAENNIQILDEYERNRLTDLYIITNNVQKAENRNVKYIILALKNDWNGALNDINKLIDNAKTGQLINGKIYADSKLYAHRAVIYKNLNDEVNANKDFKTFCMLETKMQKDITKIYNKDYFKNYYDNIRNAFQ